MTDNYSPLTGFKARMKTIRNALQLFSLLLLGLFVSTAHAEPATDRAVFEAARSFLTNCPPIKNLVLEVQSAPSTNVVRYQFRYQPGALYCRKLSPATSPAARANAYAGVAQDDSCGYWGDDWWHLEQLDPRAPRSLTTCHAVGKDLESMRHKTMLLTTAFSWFSSFGLSAAGVNKMQCDGDDFTFENPGYGLTNRASLIVRGGVLQGARVLGRYPAGEFPTDVAWNYGASKLPFPIPNEIVWSETRAAVTEGDHKSPGGTFVIQRIRVVQIEMGDPAAPMSRVMFLPDPSLLTSETIRMVVTNQEMFQLRGGRLRSTK